MSQSKYFLAVKVEDNPAYQRYLNYPEKERKVLQVFAVLHRSINQTNMNALLKTFEPDSQMGGLNGLVNKAFKEKALSDALLDNSGNNVFCHQTIILLLIMETIEQGTFELIKERAVAAVPYITGRSFSYASSADYEMDRLRQVRMHLFSRDDKKLASLAKMSLTAYPCSPYYFSGFRYLLQPYYPHIFRHFTLTAQFFIIANELHPDAIEQLSPETAIEQLSLWLESEAKGAESLSEVPRYLLAEQYVLTGELSKADALSSELANNSYLLIFKAKIKLLQGQYDQAIELYQQSMQAIKKETRKRIVYVPGLDGIYYLLALFSKNTAEVKSLIEKQMTIAQKKEGTRHFGLLYYLMNEFHNIMEGDLSWDQATVLQWHVPDESDNFILLWSLCHFWAVKKLPSKAQKLLKTASLQAKKEQHNWFYMETQLLLEKCNESLVDAVLKEQAEAAGLKTNVYLCQTMSWTPLLDLIKPVPQWQKSLLSLQAVNQKKTLLSAVEQANSLRMSWRIYLYDNACELEAREQKTGKNKKWTAGRVVSLERLHENPDQFDYLTDQDKRMCRAIETEQEFQYYGRYAKTIYSATGFAFLKEALEHPLLFLGSDPKTAVEFTQVDSILEIQSKKSQFTLKMQPYPESENTDYAVMQEGKNRLKLVQFDSQHQRIAQIIGAKGLTVPVSAKQQVLDTIGAIAPLVTIHSDIEGTEQNTDNVRRVDSHTRMQIHIQPAEEGLLFEGFVQPFGEVGPLFYPGYGHAVIMSEIEGESLQTKRDLKAEKKQLNHVLQHCPLLDTHSAGHWQIDDTEQALDTLLQLQQVKDVSLQWPQGEKLKLKKQQNLKQMQVTLRKKRDWFELDGQLKLEDGEIIAMQDLVKLIQASPGRFIQLKEGEFLALTDELKRRLSSLQFIGNKGQIHNLTAPLVDELTDGMSIKSGKHWQTLVERAEQAQNYDPELPSTLQAELRDYQLDGFKWLARLAHWGAGACLADDMGLGKTLQAIALTLHRAAQGPTLVLAPTSVCANWQDECSRFAPTLKVQLFGTGDRQKILDAADKLDVIVCSYGLLQSEAEKLCKVHWQTIIADEAQAFKNSQTKRSKAIMELQGDFKIILSGTPIENHLGELWNLFRFINPGLLGSIEHFNKVFASPIENKKDQEASQRLKNVIKPFILRRMKSDVLTELPPRTEININVELSKEETALYEALRRQAVENLAQTEEAAAGQQRIKILAEIMRLRRACCHPKLVMPDSEISGAKLQAFAEIVTELKENRHKALVFSQFVGHLAIIRDYLDSQNISYQYLDGSTPQKKRKVAIDAFQMGEGDLFLISLKAGGSGLNLTAADYVIHMDPWWNPAVEDQASDRAHRIGQKRPVTIYRLITQNTIESKIVKLHQQKRELANNLLEGSEMSGKMSVSDMYNLLKAVLKHMFKTIVIV